jgi:hypothetical protein
MLYFANQFCERKSKDRSVARESRHIGLGGVGTVQCLQYKSPQFLSKIDTICSDVEVLIRA